jgi:hypothetical protein
MRNGGTHAMKCPSCIQEFWTDDSLESHWQHFHQDTQGDLVEECLGCPCCGERRMNLLEFVPPDLEEVECQTCGRVYHP